MDEATAQHLWEEFQELFLAGLQGRDLGLEAKKAIRVLRFAMRPENRVFAYHILNAAEIVLQLSGIPEDLKDMLRNVVLGKHMEPKMVKNALMLGIQRGNVQHFGVLWPMVCVAFGLSTSNKYLDEAWRVACALNLPLSKTMKCIVLRTLIYHHYSQSAQEPSAADSHVRWHELWGRVDLLLEYSRRLQDELERLQGLDRAPGSVDKSVMLARMCALAVHNVKTSFLSTYKDVPWEEMEYLLVMFIKARTVFVTLAHLVATTPGTAAHLRCFRERLEKYVLVHRAEPDPEAAMRRLKKEPREERTSLHAPHDAILLRDWHSLKEINETLGVTIEALFSLDDEAWTAWGWLGLRWALFLVGERVKYTWLSPNLSPRWAALVEAMAPGGVLKVMAAIRDGQEHGEEGTNAKTLALSEMKQSERKKLAEEIEKLRNAADVAQREIERNLAEETEDVCFEEIRVRLATKNCKDCTKNRITEKIITLLNPAKDKAINEYAKIVSISQKINLTNEARFAFMWKGLTDLHLLSNSVTFRNLSIEFAQVHIPEVIPQVIRLLSSSSTEYTASFQTKLGRVTPQARSTPLNIVMGVLNTIQKVEINSDNKAQWIDFTARGALRELASRWHENDQVVPTTVLFSPALLGRQLRNYLNHIDEIFSSCCSLEPSILQFLLSKGFVDFNGGSDFIEKLSNEIRKYCFRELIELDERQLRDLRWSRVENDRLLRLVELKNDMFRCAREGHLFWLQRLVEDGADVSARDCQDRTLLHAAAQGGQAHVVRWLLGLGAEAVDPLAEDWRGRMALHLAETGPVAEMLLTARPVKPEGAVYSYPPLHDAALGGRAEVLTVLLRDPRDLNAVHEGCTPMSLAALGGHSQAVRLLLKAGARYPAEGAQPLCAAARSGSSPTVQELLRGASPPPPDDDCWDAIFTAAVLGYDQPFSVLIDELSARGRLEWGPNARELLYRAGFGGSCAIVLSLLDRWPGLGVLSESLMPDAGLTVLHAAACKGHAELVRVLIERGADPLLDAQGMNALAFAATSGSPKTIDVLVENIPSCSRKAALGKALCQASGGNDLSAVQRLVCYGADVDAVDRFGQTSLVIAAGFGRTEVVKWLLQQGADPRLGPAPPLSVATQNGRQGAVKILAPPLKASALTLAVKARVEGSPSVKADARGVLERILGRVVAPLRSLSSTWSAADLDPTTGTYSRGNRRREKAENNAVLQWKEEEEQERLRLLQQVDSGGRTALHLAASVSALPVVEYLLEREGELLRRVYSKHKNTGVPRLNGLTVYARTAKGATALQWGAAGLCAPSVAEALLQRMGDEVWLALGHKSLQEVRGMAVEALEIAATRPDGGPLVRTLCGWVSSKGEGLLGGEGLQDIRRRAVVALGSGQDERRRVLAVLLPLGRVPLVRVAASEAVLCHLRLAAALAMAACLRQGAGGEMAVQLLCLWVCGLSEDTVVPEDKLLKMVCDAMRISEGRDGRLFDLFSSVIVDYILNR